MADRQFGPYRLVRQIAVGGMAEIHLARVEGGRGADKYVALKMIHPNFAEDEQFIEMLIDEARISIQLHHPNIAHTFDLGCFGETYYIIMEFVDGADLYKILRRGSERDVVTPIDVAAYVVKEVAQALEYAHHKHDDAGRPLQIVHRDVSPQNVLIGYDGAVKLVDFGIAKAASKAQQTAAGVIKGKYYYMSPEQALGEPLDLRTDIFSAGIVLYELLSGQMLYLEEDVHRLLDRVRRADIASVRTLRRDVPGQLERIVMRALARRREDRYQSAGDLAADLERFLDASAPAFNSQRLVNYMQAALGDAAVPVLPAVAAPAVAAPIRRARGGGSRPALAPAPEEISDENSMIFRVDDLARGRRRSDPPASGPVGVPAPAPAPAARRAPAPARGRGTERTRPISTQGYDGDDSTTVAGRPASEQTSDEPPTTAAGPSGVRRAAAAPTTPVPSKARVAPVLAPGLDLADYEPTEIEAMAPGPPAAEADPFPLDADDDGPTFTRDPSPRVALGEASTARGRVAPVQPAALVAHTPSPAASQVRRPRESRRTPPGGTGAPSVLQSIVGLPSAPHPRPARGAGAPLSDGVPAALAEPAPSGAPTAPAGGRGGAPARPGGRSLSLGVQAGPLDPTFDQPTAPGTSMPGPLPPSSAALPSGPSAAPPPASVAWSTQPTPASAPWPGSGPVAAHPPAAIPDAVPVFPFPPPSAPPQPPLPSISRQLMALELDELPAQYRIKPSRSSVALRIALAIVVLLGLGAAVALVIRGGGPPPKPTAQLIIDSSPDGATVIVDGKVQPEKTPMVFRATAPGRRHELELRLAGHKTYRDTVLMPDDGGEVRVSTPLLTRTVSLIVRSVPGGAEVWIGGTLKGTTDGTFTDLAIDDATRIEVRLKGFPPQTRDIAWEDEDQQTEDFVFLK